MPMAEKRRSFSRPRILLTHFTGAGNSGSPGSDEQSSSSDSDEPIIPKLKEKSKSDKCLMGGPKQSANSLQNVSSNDGMERTHGRTLSWLMSRKKSDDGSILEKATAIQTEKVAGVQSEKTAIQIEKVSGIQPERPSGARVADSWGRPVQRTLSAKESNAHGMDRLAEQVAERLRERPLTPRSAPVEETASSKLEYDEIEGKISAIDAKVERLMLKRERYVARMMKLEAHKEKIAGPIQWSAWQQLSRFQMDAMEMANEHKSPPQAESPKASVRSPMDVKAAKDRFH